MTPTHTTPFGLRLAFNLGLAVGGFLLAVIAGEALIRLVAPRQLYRFPVGMFRDDPLLGYRLATNFRGVIDAEEYTTEIRTNSQGLRSDTDYGSKTPRTIRILALGDSFTMAYSVDLPDTFPAVLQHTLRNKSGRNVEVINAGCGGYTPRQELLYLQSRGMELQPDIVIQGLYIGNDLVGNIPFEPQIGVTDGYLMSKKSSGGTLPRPVRQFLSRRSQLYNYVWPIQHALREGRKSWKPARALAKFRIDSAGIPTTEWEATLDVLQSMADLTRARGIDFIVALFPEGIQVDAERWQNIVDQVGDDQATYSAKEINRRMGKELATREINSVDLLPAFLRARSDGLPLYFQLDSHWTPEGNHVTGQTLGNYLIEHSALFGAKT